MRKHKNKITVFVLILMVYALVVVTNPIRWPEGYLKSHVLEITPLGAEFDHVMSLIKKRNWEIKRFSEEWGFRYRGKKGPKTIGDKYIMACLGSYMGSYLGVPVPFRVYVYVYWGFDLEGRLTDIWIYKEMDAP